MFSYVPLASLWLLGLIRASASEQCLYILHLDRQLRAILV